MAESKFETSTYSATAVERRSSPVAFTDEAFHSNNFESMAQSQFGEEGYQHCQGEMAGNAMISSASNTVGQFANQAVSANINEYPLIQDPNPELVRRHNNERVTYQQDVAIRYLQPPTPPPPAPVIVREIRCPQPPVAPPLVIRQRPPAPVTPPPVIIRERPPVPPPVEPPRVVNKYLPAPPPPPRKVIIERQDPLPPKPQPVIIEKWLPYKAPPERRVVVEHAPPLPPIPIQKNTIITYDAPQVDLVKNVRDLGTVRVDPHMYSVQYGSHFASSEYVLNTMAKFGLGGSYSQMVQMQAGPRLPVANHFFQNQQSMAYGERNPCEVLNGGRSEYMEKHMEEIILPDGRRKRHSSISGSNEQEVLRQAEMFR